MDACAGAFKKLNGYPRLFRVLPNRVAAVRYAVRMVYASMSVFFSERAMGRYH